MLNIWVYAEAYSEEIEQALKEQED
ncbi:conserved hypothetical protein [Planktothrix agardhii]|nr:conserved hypothetical protein [Planktothrix agardhii]